MPELPFITVLTENLWPTVEGRVIQGVLVRSVSVLKTFEPPITALQGRRITRITRRGKLLVFSFTDGLVMVLHLRRNGRLRTLPAPKGRSARDLGLVLALEGGADLQLTELGPKKAASVWLFASEEAAAAGPLADLGIEPLSPQFTREGLAAMLRQERTQAKRFLTLQRYIVGIGNTFADEILWEARLSPQALTTSLDDGEVERLHTAVVQVLEEAVVSHRREFAGQLPQREPLHLLRVHRHGKEPCPRCGTPIAVIFYEDRETYYCPVCQAGGKVYADRRRSRLLR